MRVVLFLIVHLVVYAGGQYLSGVNVKAAIAALGVSDTFYYSVHLITPIFSYIVGRSVAIRIVPNSAASLLPIGSVFLLYVAIINIILILASSEKQVSMYREILGTPALVALIASIAIGYVASSLNFLFGRGRSLHDAIQSGNLHRAAEMISEDGFDEPDVRGCTPLYWACQQGYDDIVRLLIERGANVNARDHDGSTPLRTAVFQNHVAIVERLLSANADPNLTHGDGSTPLHAAAEVGDVRVVQLLVEHGADIDAKHEYGEPIYAAAEKNQTPVVSYLIKKGACIRVHHKQQETLLHAVAFQGHDVLVAELIGRDLEVNARNIDGRIPLHYAVAEFGHHQNLRVIQRLIEAGSDKTARDRSGLTPADIARKTGTRELVRLLD